jgi:hypothetical protein
METPLGAGIRGKTHDPSTDGMQHSASGKPEKLGMSFAEKGLLFQVCKKAGLLEITKYFYTSLNRPLPVH